MIISGSAAVLTFTAFLARNLVSKFFNSVFGEYAKQIWRSWIEPRLKKPVLALLKKFNLIKPQAGSADAIDAAEYELQRLTGLVERLLIRNEELEMDVIRYRILANTKDAA